MPLFLFSLTLLTDSDGKASVSIPIEQLSWPDAAYTLTFPTTDILILVRVLQMQNHLSFCGKKLLTLFF